jgi:hypothetical protein
MVLASQSGQQTDLSWPGALRTSWQHFRSLKQKLHPVLRAPWTWAAVSEARCPCRHVLGSMMVSTMWRISLASCFLLEWAQSCGAWIRETEHALILMRHLAGNGGLGRVGLLGCGKGGHLGHDLLWDGLAHRHGQYQRGPVGLGCTGEVLLHLCLNQHLATRRQRLLLLAQPCARAQAWGFQAGEAAWATRPWPAPRNPPT